MPDETHRHIQENPDSIEIGTPGRGGAVKIYGDFLRTEEFKKKIENAKAIRNYAQSEIGGNP